MGDLRPLFSVLACVECPRIGVSVGIILRVVGGSQEICFDLGGFFQLECDFNISARLNSVFCHFVAVKEIFYALSVKSVRTFHGVCVDVIRH